MARGKHYVVGLLGFLLILPIFAQAEILNSRALAVAEDFLVSADNAQWDTAYQDASASLRLLAAKEDWISEQRLYRQLIGKPLERQLVAVRARGYYPGLPDGNYLIVLYQGRTALKDKAMEMLLLKEERSTWRVCRYTLR